MKKKILAVCSLMLIIGFALISCTSNDDRRQSTIKGRFGAMAGQKIVLQQLTINNMIKVDSVIASTDGSFSFDFQAEETGFYMLHFTDGSFITLIINPDDKLEITSDAAPGSMQYQISGNEDSQLLQNYFVKTAERETIFDSLREVFFNSTHLENFYAVKLNVDSVLRQLVEDQYSFTKNFILNNSGSFASLLLINHRFANQPIFDREQDFDIYCFIDSVLMKKYPDNSHVLEHHNRVSEIKERLTDQRVIEESLSAGRPVPDIILNDADGVSFRLSDLKGRAVLVYFWVSWSPLCRAANHQLKDIYNDYRDSGFEIYAVSLDHQARYWKDAVRLDGLTWINVSDLNGISSPVVTLFNVPQDLPYYYFCNEEGAIVAKGKKFGEIKKAIAKYFKH